MCVLTLQTSNDYVPSHMICEWRAEDMRVKFITPNISPQLYGLFITVLRIQSLLNSLE